MEVIQYIPGFIAGLGTHTLPLSAPDIEAVVSAEITRLPASLAAHADSGVDVAHGAGAVVGHVNAAVGNHVFTQPNPHVLTLPAPPGAPGGAVTLVNGAALEVFGGPLNDGGATASPHAGGAVDAHAVTQPDAHPAAAIVAALVDHPAVAIANALAAHVGANPVAVAGAVVRLTKRTFTLANATQLGDLLTLAYHAVGERVAVS